MHVCSAQSEQVSARATLSASPTWEFILSKVRAFERFIFIRVRTEDSLEEGSYNHVRSFACAGAMQYPAMNSHCQPKNGEHIARPNLLAYQHLENMMEKRIPETY